MYAKRISQIDPNEELLQLLSDNLIELPQNTDDNIGLYDDGKLIGCGFLKGNMLQGIAISKEYQGEGLSLRLISELMQIAVERGISHLRVITKPSMAAFFKGAGFRVVVDALPHAVFLEMGKGCVDTYQKKLQTYAEGHSGKCACIVMNANPFTLGHRYIIERAARENDTVFVMAVQEDCSEIPFEDRIELVKEGTRDIGNVIVISGGEYVISSFTFPSYFTRREVLVEAQGSMDAAIFAKIVAPALGVSRRYIGTEPFSGSTSAYNAVLKKILPADGIEVVVIERKAVNGQVISASDVRRLAQLNDWEAIRQMVPVTTFEYLCKRYSGA